jgi:TonB family protein
MAKRLLQVCLAIVIAMGLTGQRGSAQNGTSPESLSRRPEVIQDAPLRYPPLAWDNDIQGDVVLLLWVSEEGLVEAAEVISTPGYDMELAAMAAAKKMRFSPAMMAGAPVQVKIRYTFRFRKPEKSAQALPPLTGGHKDTRPRGRLFGRVLQKGTGDPLAGAEVYLLDLDEASRTDEQGRFDRMLPPGGYAITVNVPQHHIFETLEKVEPGGSVEVKYYVEPNRRERYRTIVWGDEGKTMVGRTTLAEAEISEVAGTAGDPIRVIMLMPGVTTSMSGLGYPVVRGVLPGDARYEMDGVQVPMLYHLGFGTAVVNPRFTSGIVFQPGGYSVQHGQFPGALVMGQAAREPEHPATATDLSIIQASLFHARPLTQNLQTLVAGRIGTLGLIVEGLASDAIFKYWDYQTKTFWQLGGEDDRLELLAFGAGNKVGERNEDGSEEVVDIGFHRVLLRERHALKSGWLQLEAEYGQEAFLAPEDEEEQTEALDAGYAYGGLRAMTSIVLQPELELHWGGEGYLQDFDFIPETDSLSIPSDGITLGAYVEAEWTPGDWTIIPGVRVDHYRYGIDSGPRKTGVDPRFGLGYQVTSWLAAKASAGVYHGPPRVTLAEGPVVIGPVPGMVGIGLERGLTRTRQLAGGLEAELPWALQIVVQGYDSSLRTGLDFSLTEENLGIESSPDEEDEPLASTGRSYGVEFVLRRQLGGSAFGWATYSLSHSERTSDGYATMPFMFDQTHVINTVVSWEVGRHWTLGSAFHLHTGRPYTPEVLDPLAADGIGHGQPFSARLPRFWKLDLRIQKREVFETWYFDFYIDILNVTFNWETIGYEIDHRGRQRREKALFFVPMLGLRAVF